MLLKHANSYFAEITLNCDLISIFFLHNIYFLIKYKSCSFKYMIWLVEGEPQVKDIRSELVDM